MQIEEWIKLLADRSKAGEIGEYFHRKQCAELLEFLVELKYYRKLTERDEDGENKCGECFWFTKLDNRCKPYDHYCKLHYMQEIRYKDEIACSDFTERDENDS